jgi:hypothetical protein
MLIPRIVKFLAAMMAKKQAHLLTFRRPAMLNTKSLCAVLLCLFGAGAAFGQADPNPPPNVFQDYKYEFFNLPNGASGNLTAINDLGVVAGTYYPTDPCCAPSASGTGYLRYPGGKIVIFTIANADAVSMTISGLNDSGELVGHYGDKTTNSTVGFIRKANGKITTFALGGVTESTIPTGINNEGHIFGRLVNNSTGADAPFLRYSDGQYLTFSVPGAVSSPNAFTYTNNINDHGVALGSYSCSNSDGQVCIFYGKPGGTLTTFAYPPNGIIPFEINNHDVIGGVAGLPDGGDDYFLRKPDGKIVLFGLNKIPNFSSLESDLLSINDDDQAIGAYSVLYEPSTEFPSGASFSYDFVRSPEGRISAYDPPSQPGTLLGDVINNGGVIAGRVVSPTAVGLFVLVPKHPLHCDGYAR